MSDIDDLLQSFTNAPPPLSLGLAPGQSAAPGGQQTTPLSELIIQGQANQRGEPPVIMGPLPASVGNLQGAPNPNMTSDPGVSQTPQPVPINYDNSQAAGAVQNALANEPRIPGGSPNAGIYGLLPQGLQHGTLRNVLGAIGDAFLVGGGQRPTYAPMMARKQVGAAMAGMDINDPQSVMAAVQRVASTGVPGSAEMADKLQQQAEQAALRKQYMEYNQNYRQQVIDDRTQYHAAETEARDQTNLRQRGQAYSGLAVRATTPAAYKAIYDRADASAKQLNSKYTAEDMGLIRPEDWSPGAMSGFGMTGNNVTQSADRASQRDQSQTNAQIAAGSRTTSAGINAGGHIAAARISAGRPSNASILQGLIQKRNNGEQLTPAEQQVFEHETQISRNSRRSVPTAAKTSQHFQNGAVYTDAHGNHARFVNGKFVPL